MNAITTLAALVLALVPVAGCAATAMERGAGSTAEPTAIPLELVAIEAATEPSFPARLTKLATPRAANRLGARVRAELGGRARLELRLCVGGGGAVTSAEVARGSGIAALDDAFAAEALTWRYQSLAAPTATVCQQVEIVYTVR